MRKTNLLFLLSFLLANCQNQAIAEVVNKAVNIRTCEVVSSKYNLQNGKLSDYWAQELIGSDLLREDIKAANISPVHENFIAVFDTPINNHNISVKNLISDKGFHAVLPDMGSKAVSFFNVKLDKGYPKAVSQFYDKMERRSLESFKSLSDFHSQFFPAYINNSMGWDIDGGRESTDIYESFQSISFYSIVVTASDNSFPREIGSLKQSAGRDNVAILVGSLSPKGLVSASSQRGEELSILAPSDEWISSANEDGSYEKSGGTSGATALVTGSLAGFELLSAYHPSTEEAKLLLKKTAIPTIHSRYEEPRQNGAGLLNAYKLGRVAHHLKEKCLTQGDFEACMSEEIRKDENYSFNIVDKLDLARELREVFPECLEVVDAKIKERECSDVKRIFKKLRETVLLEPNDAELWEVLGCVYEKGGFSINAEGLKNISADTKEEVLGILTEEIKHGDSSEKVSVIETLIYMGRAEEVKLLEKLAEDEDPRVKSSVAYGAGNIGGAEGVKLLEKLSEDEDPRVKSSVAYGAGNIGGAEGVKLLEKLAEDEDPRVKSSVAYGAGNIGGAEGVKLLEKLSEDEHPMVRINVSDGAGNIGGAEGVKLLEKLSEDEHPEVKMSVADAVLLSMRSVEGIKLLQKLAEDDEYPWIRKHARKRLDSLQNLLGLK